MRAGAGDRLLPGHGSEAEEFSAYDASMNVRLSVVAW